MHKKILVGLVVILMTASMISCGNKDKNKQNDALSEIRQTEMSTDRAETSRQEETSKKEETNKNNSSEIYTSVTSSEKENLNQRPQVSADPSEKTDGTEKKSEAESVEKQETIIIEGMTITQGVGELPADFRDTDDADVKDNESANSDSISGTIGSSSNTGTTTENTGVSGNFGSTSGSTGLSGNTGSSGTVETTPETEESKPDTEDSSDNEETEPPASDKDPASYTYEEFLAMEPDKQQAHFEQFSTIEAYFSWYNSAKAKYEANDDSIIIDGSGNIDIGDLMKP